MCHNENHEPAAASVRPCPTCGSAMPRDAIWCVHCRLYQAGPDGSPARTQTCTTCGAVAPLPAGRCYRCKSSFGPAPSRFSLQSWSVGSISALVALFSTAVALIASSQTLVLSLMQTEANLQVKLQNEKPETRTLTALVVNSGDRIGVVNRFMLTVHVSKTGQGWREMLSVGATQQPSIAVAGASQQSVALVPDGSDSHWDLFSLARRLQPKATDDDLEREVTQMSQSMRDPDTQCQIVFEVDAADRLTANELPVGPVKRCSEFLLKAYAVQEASS